MTLSRRFIRHSAAAALLAACVAATGANLAFAAGQAGAPAGTGAGAEPAGSQGPHGDRGSGDGAQHGFDKYSFGRSRPGAPDLDLPPPASPMPHGGPPHGPGGFGLFGRLHRLRLSEAQQDQLFAIVHAAAPQQRNQEKAERKAREALRALGAVPQFDEARATAAARELGQAVASGAVLRARLESQVLALLTPEQREQVLEGRPQGPLER